MSNTTERPSLTLIEGGKETDHARTDKVVNNSQKLFLGELVAAGLSPANPFTRFLKEHPHLTLGAYFDPDDTRMLHAALIEETEEFCYNYLGAIEEESLTGEERKELERVKEELLLEIQSSSLSLEEKQRLITLINEYSPHILPRSDIKKEAAVALSDPSGARPQEVARVLKKHTQKSNPLQLV